MFTNAELFFFFNDTATTEIYTLSLHDALPICRDPIFIERGAGAEITDVDGNVYVDYVCSWGPLIHGHAHPAVVAAIADRKSTRLNSSHANISYAVFCLKKKNNTMRTRRTENTR